MNYYTIQEHTYIHSCTGYYMLDCANHNLFSTQKLMKDTSLSTYSCFLDDNTEVQRKFPKVTSLLYGGAQTQIKGFQATYLILFLLWHAI